MTTENHPLPTASDPEAQKPLIHGKYGMGWKPDMPRLGLRPRAIQLPKGKVLPEHSDLRKVWDFPMYNQLTLGSCVAQSWAEIIVFRQGVLHQKGKLATILMPSRLQIYYNARYIDHDIPYDNGTQLSSGADAVRKWGICSEDHWQYDINQFTHRPPLSCYQEAARHLVRDTYKVVSDHDQIVAHLTATDPDGTPNPHPIVFGFTVYENMESETVARTGILGMPTGKVLGGHAVALWGHDDQNQCYLVRNHWSAQWGMAGFFTMPYEYVHSQELSQDFWAAVLVA